MDEIKNLVEAGKTAAFKGKNDEVHGRAVILDIFELKTGKIATRKVYGAKCISGSLFKRMKFRLIRNE